ncbi:MAG: hypothetical protein ACJ767_08945 [Chloroflexota bacterium]
MTDRGSLIDRLVGPIAAGDDPRSAQFVRGLAIGALVGAAIAGSTLWQRRRTTGRKTLSGTVSRVNADAPEAPPGA